MGNKWVYAYTCCHVIVNWCHNILLLGNDVLRECSMKSSVERPEAIRSTNLPKHIATMTQLVNLQESELDVLAGFMGHDIKTHREYYRLPQETTPEVTKLLLAQESRISIENAGKRLDEIQVDLDEDLTGENCLASLTFLFMRFIHFSQNLMYNNIIVVLETVHHNG